MAESKLRELSMDFAVAVIKLCEQIKGHRSLVNQLERSATSIGANIHEANYAHGRADFIAKAPDCFKRMLRDRVLAAAVYSSGIGGQSLGSRSYKSMWYDSTPPHLLYQHRKTE